MKRFICYFVLLFLVLPQPNIFPEGIKENLYGEYFSIAEGYTELKKYDKAIDYYKKAEKSKQYRNAVKYNLAQIYALQKDWENCLKYLEPMYNQVPDNIKISTAYAYALASAGKETKAIEIYKKIISKENETPEYFFNYVRILVTAKKYEESLKLLEESKEKFTQEEDKKTIAELEEKIKNILNPPKKTKDTSKEKSGKKQSEKESPQPETPPSKP
ncbi:tetratricopeptide repeat protein [Treponema pedis]|uniref:TPR protein n=1 Tax=Treponema pedis TaxID=409322 RepID=A0A7S6WM69_9SPIR|nr:CDC27 family protein [Treponema pedis]QOW59670.1 hypothetical protein IFE08_07220 [Treponema pedis]QSI05053.1 hypothetical protein DYQ05_09055 [Treponema pedis]